MTSRTSWLKLLDRSELPDLCNGLNAAITIVTVGVNTKYQRRLMRWASQVYEHVMKSGPTLPERMRSAKEYFTTCRYKAISGKFGDWGELPQFPYRAKDSPADRRRILHQISRTSRALREADNETVNESLKSHLELSQQGFETPEGLRESWRTFLRGHFGGAMEGTLGSVKPSSSFLRKKAERGAPGEIKEITDSFRKRVINLTELGQLTRSVGALLGPDSVKIVNTDLIRQHDMDGSKRSSGLLWSSTVEQLLFPYDKSTECNLIDWSDQRDILFSLVACWDAINMDQLPKCRQVAVRERGWKVRVATPLEAPFRYLLGVINSSLLTTLERKPQVVAALHGRPAEKLDWSEGKRRNLVFSADLKSATDYFPQDLMMDAAEVLGEGWPTVWSSLFRRAVGPHKLYSPDRSEYVATKRGILMGSPVSWPLLSMYSAWIHHLSGSDGWYAVCGDDYIGCHTYETYRRYLKHRTATGAVGSPGKDVLGTQSVGVFAEELVAVGRCRWIPTVSVRAVLADPKSGKPSWSQGPEVSAALDVLSWTSDEKGRVCRSLHKGAYRHLYRHGIDPVGPRWVGCAGFPGVPTQTSLLRARRMVSQNSEQVIKWITSLELAWSTSSGCPQIRSRIEREFFEAGEFLLYSKSNKEGDWGPLRDVVSSRIGQLSWCYFLAGESKETPAKSPILGRLSKVIAKVSREIGLRGRWVPPDEVILKGEGICRRLQDLEPCCRPIPFRSNALKVVLLRASTVSRPINKRPSTGPGSPFWGGARKRAKLS